MAHILTPVEYDEDTCRAELEEDLRQLVELGQQDQAQWLDGKCATTVLSGLFRTAGVASIRFKRPSYAVEEEVRSVVLVRRDELAKVVASKHGNK